MIDIKPHLRTYLLESKELADLVGSSVYIDEIPEEATIPFVFFRRQGSGVLDQDSVRDAPRFQFICEAATPQDATAIYLVLFTLLHQKTNFNAGDAVVRSAMQSAGPSSGKDPISGNPQTTAYFVVRY